MITGGCGFIGSCLVRKTITDTPYHVVNVDKMTYAATKQSVASVEKDSRYKFYQADICDIEKMIHILREEKPNAILHLAAESHVDRSIHGPKEFLHTNIYGTYNLLQASMLYCHTFNPDDFKFIHVSTDEVYGALHLNDQKKFNEDTPYKPNSPYSASKASADFLARSWFKTFGLPTITTHASNNFGPYQFPEKLIPKTIIQFFKTCDVPVYGDGKYIRDWLHVEDHCDALLTVLEKGKPGEVYDIGGDSERANIDIVRTIGDLVEQWLPKETAKNYDAENHIKFVTDRPGHDRRYAIDSSKIKSELGWKPKITFEKGLDATIKWYMQNKKWWTNL